jgi:hypothetical protein
MNQYMNSKLLDSLRKVVNEKTEFPYGTLVYFGPDATNVTKIVAVVIKAQDSNPILKSWSGPEIISNQNALSEIGHFFIKYQVDNIIMTHGIVGCPHIEGVDYEVGEGCPYCPYWSTVST